MYFFSNSIDYWNDIFPNDLRIYGEPRSASFVQALRNEDLPRLERNLDPDGDGLSNLEEIELGTDPKKLDTDGDGLSDFEEVRGVEVSYPADYPNADLAGDSRRFYSNPRLADSDGDTLSDKDEVQKYLTNPGSYDSDGDGIFDHVELGFNRDGTPATNPSSSGSGSSSGAGSDSGSGADAGSDLTDPNDYDSDGDGMPDGWERRNNLDPNDASGDNGSDGDPDGDGVPNNDEQERGTNPSCEPVRPKWSMKSNNFRFDVEKIFLAGFSSKAIMNLKLVSLVVVTEAPAACNGQDSDGDGVDDGSDSAPTDPCKSDEPEDEEPVPPAEDAEERASGGYSSAGAWGLTGPVSSGPRCEDCEKDEDS